SLRSSRSSPLDVALALRPASPPPKARLQHETVSRRSNSQLACPRARSTCTLCPSTTAHPFRSAEHKLSPRQLVLWPPRHCSRVLPAPTHHAKPKPTW